MHYDPNKFGHFNFGHLIFARIFSEIILVEVILPCQKSIFGTRYPPSTSFTLVRNFNRPKFIVSKTYVVVFLLYHQSHTTTNVIINDTHVKNICGSSRIITM